MPMALERLARSEIDRLRADLKELYQAEMAQATEKGYAHDMRTFRRWCRRARRQPLPASPETVALWIADLLRSGHKVATASRYAAGVAFQHRREGFPNPVDETVRKALKGARRIRCEPVRQMRPLTIAQLRQIARKLARGADPVSLRNRAIVVLGFATALRRSSLARLRFEDLHFRPHGIEVFVRREKQDRQGTGRTVAAPTGRLTATCPVAALKAWLAERGRDPGPLFTRLDNGRLSALDPLTPTAVGNIVKAAIASAGIDARDYGSHSLRAGLITAAGQAGVNHLVIAETSGHRSLDSLKRYFRPENLFQACAGAWVGL
jgi:integrase